MRDYPMRAKAQHISIGNWILTVLFTGFPVLGLVFSLFFLCSKNKTKRNYAVAALIWHLVVLTVLIAGYFITQAAWKDGFDKIFQPIKDMFDGWGIKLP